MRKILWSRKALLLVLAILVVVGLATGLSFQGCGPPPNTAKTIVFQEARQTYDALLKATSFGENLLYRDNLTGRIVWNGAQFMESLLNMYELTRDRRYLEVFIKHADHVLQVRDDRARRPDYAGRVRPGWQTGSYYTLGIPVTIPDDRGEPALEVQGIHRAANDHTVVEIIREEDGDHFTLLVRNGFRRSVPLEVKWENLTIEGVEAVVNKDLSPDSWIKIKVLGNSPPKQGIYPLRETYRMVLHELHTPIIGIPFLRFADLVFRNPELALYKPKAKQYVQALEQSFQDYSGSWREDAEGGYFVFEPGGKYWASGLPVPYNGLSVNGLFLLWLWRVTGNSEYLDKALAIAKKVQSGITFLPDGTITMPYWLKDSLPYTGWEGRQADPVNGLYVNKKPNPATEDVSHFSLTLRFIVEAWRDSLVFEENDLKAIAKTFTDRIWRPADTNPEELCDPDWRRGVYLAHNLDGKGRAYDYAIAYFALLSRWESSILDKAFEVYSARYKDLQCIDIDYLYGTVMLGWGFIALYNSVHCDNYTDCQETLKISHE